MANYGSGMDSNTFVVIFGSFRISTKSGPLDRLFIAEILLKISDDPESLKIVFLHISFLGKSNKLKSLESRGGDTTMGFFGGSKTIFNLDHFEWKRKNRIVESW